MMYKVVPQIKGLHVYCVSDIDSKNGDTERIFSRGRTEESKRDRGKLAMKRLRLGQGRDGQEGETETEKGE